MQTREIFDAMMLPPHLGADCDEGRKRIRVYPSGGTPSEVEWAPGEWWITHSHLNGWGITRGNRGATDHNALRSALAEIGVGLRPIQEVPFRPWEGVAIASTWDGDSAEGTYPVLAAAWRARVAAVPKEVELWQTRIATTLPWCGLADAMLPGGKHGKITHTAWVALWRLWCQIAPGCTREGLWGGESGEHWEIQTLYSPLWEAGRWIISSDGGISACCEQQCPYPPMVSPRFNSGAYGA